MKKFLTILFILVFFVVSTKGQKEMNNWFFGENAGLKFEEFSTNPIAGGQINYNEGISCMSDCNGNLLLYTDGITVWNKNHVIMENGTGLSGHQSATQGSIIIPHPGDCNLFFIFTLDAKESGFTKGLRYSVADMSLQNGMGEITTKNVLLYSPSSEKLTAVWHSNGTDVWVITHGMNNNSFYAHLVSSGGVDSNPIISSVGMSFNNPLDAIGQMKTSPDGSRLAYVTLTSKTLEIFDFDNSTGILSTPVTIPSTKFTVDGGLYGLEFSPEGTKLYVSNPSINYLSQSGNLYQIDLNAGSAVDIINSVTVVGNNTPPTDLRALQLGADGKIYVSRSLGNHLGVISNPEASGLLCDYIDLGASIGNGVCSWSLPNFITSFFDLNNTSIPLKSAFDFKQLCTGNPTHFYNESEGSPFDYNWDFGDGNTSNITSPSHTYESPGEYTVTLTVSRGCCSDWLEKKVVVDDCEFAVYVPNAFSPDGDGVNDIFLVQGVGVRRIHLMIYNRWGEMLFESNDIQKGWDGDNAQTGLFGYVLNVELKNGKTERLMGHINLVR